jgi:hypothetical protein
MLVDGKLILAAACSGWNRLGWMALAPRRFKSVVNYC